MGDILKSIVLGILEGITEFLPISSTGHLIIGVQVLQFPLELRNTFEIFIQIGALFAIILFYARDLFQEARTVHKDESVQRWWLAIGVAAFPALAIGYLLADTLQIFFHPSVVAVSMIVGGMIMYAAEVYQERQTTTSATIPETVPSLTTTAPAAIPRSNDEISISQALVIGLFQVLALIPGMSRSAMSIIGGMFAGLSRPVATRFSFYLAIPVLGSATTYSLLKSLSSINSTNLLLLVIGAAVSGIVAWGVIAWLLRYVARHNFVPFAIYRIIVGIIILLLLAIMPGLN